MRSTRIGSALLGLTMVATSCAASPALVERSVAAEASTTPSATQSTAVEEPRSPVATEPPATEDLPEPANSGLQAMDLPTSASVEKFAFELHAAAVATRAPEPIDELVLVNPQEIETQHLVGWSFSTETDGTEVLIVPGEMPGAPTAIAALLDEESTTSYLTLLSAFTLLDEADIMVDVSAHFAQRLDEPRAFEGERHTIELRRPVDGEHDGPYWILTIAPRAGSPNGDDLFEAMVPAAPGNQSGSTDAAPLLDYELAKAHPDVQGTVFFRSETNNEWDLHSLDLGSGEVTPITPVDGIHVGWSTPVSPDGTKVAYRLETDVDRHEVYVADLDGGNAQLVAYVDEIGTALEWSPDGKALFVNLIDDGEVVVARLDITLGEYSILARPDEGHAWLVGMSGEHFAYADIDDGDRTIVRIDPDTGERYDSLAIGGAASAYISDDGSAIAQVTGAARNERTDPAMLRIIEMGAQMTIHELPPTHLDLVGGATISPNGRHVVYTLESPDGTQALWMTTPEENVDGWSAAELTTGIETTEVDFRWTSDSTAIVATALDETVGDFRMYYVPIGPSQPVPLNISGAPTSTTSATK